MDHHTVLLQDRNRIPLELKQKQMDAELRERKGRSLLNLITITDSHTLIERKLPCIPSFTLKHIGHRHLLESVKLTKGLIYVLQERHLVMTEE